MTQKLFHPIIENSVVDDLDAEMLGISAMFLHDLGWLTQQGMFDEAVERLRFWAENAPEAFLMACSNGLSAILRAKQ